MVWRFLSYLSFLLAGGVAGWFASPWFAALQLLADASIPAQAGALTGVLAGALLAGAVWLVRDLALGHELLDRVKNSQLDLSAGSGGIWGELSDRIRRQLRLRDQQIAASDNRLQDFLAALQASPNGIIMLDPASRIEWFNQTAAAQFGLDVTRDLLQHIGNLVRDPVFAAYLEGRDYQAAVVMQGHSGSNAQGVKLEVQLHPYSDGHHLLLARDITAIELADVMRRDFVANVSHEIRTPLTVLTGFVETLQSLPLEESQRNRYLELMAQQAERMQTLVSDLLTLSKLEGSPPVSATDWFNVSWLMQAVEVEARALADILRPPGGVALQIRFDCAPNCQIAGSQAELLSAMTNLACNAVRYTPPGGVVAVVWQRLSEGQGEFAVQDNGPGIAAEHLPRLTERFYRVDHSRSRDTGGTGLGLAIVKHVVQRHGAQLGIESAPGRGSRFSMVFPAGRVARLPH